MITPPSQDWILAGRTDNGNKIGVAVYYIQNAGVQFGTSVWSLNSKKSATLTLMEYAGVANSAALDVSAVNSGNGFLLNSGITTNTSQASALALTFFTSKDPGVTFGAETNSFNEVVEIASNKLASVVEEKNISEISSQSTEVTASVSDDWAGIIVIFKDLINDPTDPNYSKLLSSPHAIVPQYISATFESDCTTLEKVKIELSARDAERVLVSNDKFFVDATWRNFDENKSIDWELLPGDGNKTVYVLFKSKTENLSNLLRVEIVLDKAGNCGLGPKENTEIVKIPALSEINTEQTEVEAPLCNVNCSNIYYDLYVQDQFGNEHHSNTRFATVEKLSSGVDRISMELENNDFKYDDFTVDIDTSVCETITFQVIKAKISKNKLINVKLTHGKDSKNIKLWDGYSAKKGAKKNIVVGELYCADGDKQIFSPGNIQPVSFQKLSENRYNADGGFFEIYEAEVSTVEQGTSSFGTSLPDLEDDYLKGATITFIDGDLVGKSRNILAFNSTFGVITVDFPFNISPQNSDRFIVIKPIKVNIEYSDLPALEDIKQIEPEVDKQFIYDLTVADFNINEAVSSIVQVPIGEEKKKLIMSTVLEQGHVVEDILNQILGNPNSARIINEYITFNEYDLANDTLFKSRIEEIRALGSLTKIISENGGTKPVVVDYITFGSMDFNFLIANPLEVKQTIKFSAELPREVEITNILKNEGFTIYKKENSDHLTATVELVLEPGQIIKRNISVEDIWNIEPVAIDRRIKDLDSLSHLILGTSLSDHVEPIINNIKYLLSGVQEIQKEMYITPQQKIINYRKKVSYLEEIDSDLGIMWELLPLGMSYEVSKISSESLERLIVVIFCLIVLVFIAILIIILQKRRCDCVIKTINNYQETNQSNYKKLESEICKLIKLNEKFSGFVIVFVVSIITLIILVILTGIDVLNYAS